jgi:lipoprotein-anchoring transpeptidase ErfK/SrfK
MKSVLLPVLLVGTLVGGAAWYGLSRGPASAQARAEVESRLELAERLVEQNPAKAIEAVADLEKAEHNVGDRGAWIVLAAHAERGDHAAVVSSAADFQKKFPQSEKVGQVERLRVSSALALGGDHAAAVRADAEKLVQASPDSADTSSIQVSLGMQELASGDLAAARKRLESILPTADLADPAVLSFAEAIGAANLEKFFSDVAGASDQEHVVRTGDSINLVARKHKLTEELLMRANNISDPRRLRVGQKLRVPAVDFSLHANIGTNVMILRNGGEFFKIYRVRTGREEGATPVGTFKLLNKKRAPTWRPGNGYVYGPGDPNNELGTRWMAFEGDILGIHGTLHPETIGHYASNGCIGLATPEMEELFDLVIVGTPLTIEGKRNPERFKVIPAAQVPPPREVAAKQ